MSMNVFYVFKKNKAARPIRVIKNLFSIFPLSSAWRYDKTILEHFSRVIKSSKIDVMLVEDAVMGRYAMKLKRATGVPYYVRTHNVDYVTVNKVRNNASSFLIKLLLAVEERKVYWYEKKLLVSSDGFSAISDNDSKLFKEVYGLQANSVVGAGVDCDKYTPSNSVGSKLDLIHIGSVTDFTKREGLEWFVKEVLPLLRRSYSDLKLHLVGRGSERESFSIPGVVQHGFVDNDLEYFHSASIFVAPQFSGSGVRLKILNAMASGKAVVCTPLACEGIDVVDRKSIVLANTKDEFVNSIESLLKNQELVEDIGRSARELVSKKYSWSLVAERLKKDLLMVSNSSMES